MSIASQIKSICQINLKKTGTSGCWPSLANRRGSAPSFSSDIRTCSGSRVSDFGFRISNFGFWVSVLEFRVSSLGFRVSNFGSRVSGLGLRVSGFGSRVFGSRVSGLGFQVSGLGFQVSGLGSRVPLSGRLAGEFTIQTSYVNLRIITRILGLGFRVPLSGRRLCTCQAVRGSARPSVPVESPWTTSPPCPPEHVVRNLTCQSKQVVRKLTRPRSKLIVCYEFSKQ